MCKHNNNNNIYRESAYCVTENSQVEIWIKKKKQELGKKKPGTFSCLRKKSFKGILYPLPKISMFWALSQKYEHIFEKKDTCILW